MKGKISDRTEKILLRTELMKMLESCKKIMLLINKTEDKKIDQVNPD